MRLSDIGSDLRTVTAIRALLHSYGETSQALDVARLTAELTIGELADVIADWLHDPATNVQLSEPSCADMYDMPCTSLLADLVSSLQTNINHAINAHSELASYPSDLVLAVVIDSATVHFLEHVHLTYDTLLLCGTASNLAVYIIEESCLLFIGDYGTDGIAGSQIPFQPEHFETNDPMIFDDAQPIRPVGDLQNPEADSCFNEPFDDLTADIHAAFDKLVDEEVDELAHELDLREFAEFEASVWTATGTYSSGFVASSSAGTTMSVFEGAAPS